MIVIDVGCAKYGGDESIPYLIEEFQPEVLYGFDPSSALSPDEYAVGDTWVITRRQAAWTYDGEVGFIDAGLVGRVEDGAPMVECFDLAAFIAGLPSDAEVALKVDAEGAEFVLLPHLIACGMDLRLKLAWVEYHCLECGRGGGGHRHPGCSDAVECRRDELEAAMRCEMHRWNR